MVTICTTVIPIFTFNNLFNHHAMFLTSLMEEMTQVLGPRPGSAAVPVGRAAVLYTPL